VIGHQVRIPELLSRNRRKVIVSRADGYADDAEVLWFWSLADVPGISYTTPQDVDRAALSGGDVVPRVFEFNFDGGKRRSLMWSTRDGRETGASPAHQRAYGDGEKTSARGALRRLREALELPGTLSDYHFAIQHAAETAHRERTDDPSLVGEAERLWWLDIELVESHPRTVEHSSGEIYRVTAYERLVQLYEGEGYLTEALETAERATSLGQQHLMPTVERLRANLAELEAEEAGA
jgi:hypothetical protein